MVTLNVAVCCITAIAALAPASRWEYKLFSLGVILLACLKLAPPDQHQWTRYGLLMFPAYMNLARGLSDRAGLSGVVFAAFLVNALFLFAFVNWSLVAQENFCLRGK